MTAALAERPKTRTRGKAAKAPETEPVVATTTEPDQPVQEEPAAPDAEPEATPEPAEPAETPAFVRPTPEEIRSRRQGLGVSRQALAQLAKISASRVWASEQPGKDVTDEHIKAIVAALDYVDAEGLAPGIRPKKSSGITRAVLESRIKSALVVAEEASRVKSVATLHGMVGQIAAILSGAADVAPEAANETKDGDAE